jgi:uncharacterized membrane protein
MSKYLLAYVATTVVFFALDFMWLSAMTSRLYRVVLGDLLLEKPNLPMAGLFYLIYVGGIVAFAVAPALNGGTWSTALLLGAMLGLVAYGTYDFTNLATLRDWSILVTAIDLIWGISVTAIAATLGFLVVKTLAGE